jgi:hypothetical protein
MARIVRARKLVRIAGSLFVAIPLFVAGPAAPAMREDGYSVD